MMYSNGTPGPRKIRSLHYRLPLGAICCIFIWFLWMMSRHSPAPDLNTTLHSTVSCDNIAIESPEYIKVLDFRQYPVFTSEIKNEVRGALRYFALTSKACPGTPTCARIFLHENTCYADFMCLAEVVQEEGLAMKMEKGSVLVGE